MNSLTMEPEIGSNIDISRPADSEIATLAYQLWQDRGCPIGSPDEDWFLAEAVFMNRQRVSDGII